MLKVAIIFGGFSGERQISEKSAAFVYECLRESYECYLIDIDTKQWSCIIDQQKYAVDKNDFSVDINGKKLKFDIVFNVLHGSPAEDGKLPAYFEMLNIPFTGPSSLPAALTMDKYLTNSVLKYHGISCPPSLIVRKGEIIQTEEIIGKFQLPLFVKPNQSGSSLGVSKVKNFNELTEAVSVAFQHGNEVVVEQGILGREFSCGVYLHQSKIIPLPVTEIVSHNEFFDFAAKYLNQSDEITPANISQHQLEVLQNTAVRVFKILKLKSFARIDMILTTENIPFVLEVNTVPGLSPQSIIPQQLKAAGLEPSEFFDLMIRNELT